MHINAFQHDVKSPSEIPVPSDVRQRASDVTGIENWKKPLYRWLRSAMDSGAIKAGGKVIIHG